MAKVTGNAGLVKIGAVTVAGVQRFSLTEINNVFEDTDLSDTDMTYAAGDSGWSAEIECHWDKADATGQGALVKGAEVALVLQPEGDTTGDETRSGNAIVSQVQSGNDKNARVTKNVTVQGNGALTIGTVA